MKVYSSEQIKAWDAYTISQKSISSSDLMEQAAQAFVDWFTRMYQDTLRPVVVFAGPGNNGGDGLAIARLLHRAFYPVKVYHCFLGGELSADNKKNLERLPVKDIQEYLSLEPGAAFPEIQSEALIIDALLGIGTNRPLDGFLAKLVSHINEQDAVRLAVDIPSGMFADTYSPGLSIRASRTLTFQAPKLAFFLPENTDHIGDWEVADIGLAPNFLAEGSTVFEYLDRSAIAPFRQRRARFDHKGTYGHALLVAGSYGMIGAAILSARACLRAGVGLLTVHLPQSGYAIMQSSVPEAMVSVDRHTYCISEFPKLEQYQAVGVGPGLGKKKTTRETIGTLLETINTPLILDADALNILAKEPTYLDKLPEGSILTPHPGEFRRLFGKSENGFERLKLARAVAEKYRCFIVLKGAHTAIVSPEGSIYFNSTGNPGMATAGSGDVLTGILTGLRAQGYPALQAALLGVYLHGLAGDLAAEDLEHESLLAGDIVQFLGRAFKQIHN